MVTRKVIIANRAGIHARPAAMIVKVANKFSSEITLSKDDDEVNAKSIMGIFSLDLSKELTLNIHSDNCSAFLDEIKSYIVK